MAEAAILRQALAAFLGEIQYRKFVDRGMHRGRLAYWPELAWSRFAAAYPELAVGPDELTAALRVCHLHSDPDAVYVSRVLRFTDAAGGRAVQPPEGVGGGERSPATGGSLLGGRRRHPVGTPRPRAGFGRQGAQPAVQGGTGGPHPPKRSSATSARLRNVWPKPIGRTCGRRPS